MCYREEMHLRRQELIVRMIPPLCGEDTELAALNDGLDLVLDGIKVLRRSLREILRISLGADAGRTGKRQLVGLQDRVLQIGCGNRICLECLYRADPVECVKMIEVNHMVLHRLGCSHDIANVIGVLRNRDAESILYRTQ